MHMHAGLVSFEWPASEARLQHAIRELLVTNGWLPPCDGLRRLIEVRRNLMDVFEIVATGGLLGGAPRSFEGRILDRAGGCHRWGSLQDEGSLP